MYIVSIFFVVSFFNFFIKEIVFCFKLYFFNILIIGNVNMNNDIFLFEIKEFFKIVKI